MKMHCIKRYKQQQRTLKNCWANKLQVKITYNICSLFNRFKVCPSLPSFVIRVLLVPCFNVLIRYFYVSLSLVDFQKVLRRINRARDEG